MEGDLRAGPEPNLIQKINLRGPYRDLHLKAVYGSVH